LQFGIAQGLKLTFCNASEIIAVAAAAEDGSPNETDENIILK
jgi:hypothetical protein